MLLASMQAFVCCAVPFDPSNTNSWADSTICPTSPLAFEMVCPDGRPVTLYRLLSRRNAMCAEGWFGEIFGRDTIVYEDGKSARGDDLVLRFRDGVLDEVSCRGKDYRYSGRVERQPDFPACLWPSAREEERIGRESGRVWSGKSRWRLFYDNPNKTGALCAMVALLGIALVLMRRRWWIVAGVLVAVVSLTGLVLTGSRGAFVGFIAGAAICALTDMVRHFTLRRFGIVVGVVAVGVGALLLSPYSSRFTKSLFERDASNSMRLSRIKAVPSMLVDAPGGWSDVPVGVTYAYWYQPAGEYDARRSLVNTHAEYMVRNGWTFRILYVFGWTFLLVCLAKLAWRGKPAPLAVWVCFGIVCFFNDMTRSWTLWIVPVGVLLLQLRHREFRAALKCARLLFVSLAVTVVIGGALFGTGLAMRSASPAIRADGAKVFLNGESPKAWIVEDSFALGGWLTVGKDIRQYYARHGDAPAVGFVRRVADLPEDAETVVFCGTACSDFLTAVREGSGFPALRRTLLVSPPFPVGDVPEAILQKYDVHFVVGGLVMRHFPEVSIENGRLQKVDGAMLYIPDWIDRVVRFCYTSTQK